MVQVSETDALSAKVNELLDQIQGSSDNMDGQLTVACVTYVALCWNWGIDEDNAKEGLEKVFEGFRDGTVGLADLAAGRA